MKYTLWAKVKKHQKIVAQATDEWQQSGKWDEDSLHEAMSGICHALDVARPVLLKKHKDDANSFSRIVFTKNDFVEPVAFDQLEVEFLAQDDKSKKKDKGGREEYI